jgi:RimJ/RimL family protein N-acetyltransferase
MVTLETERLLLRVFCESDIDAYAEMCSDAEVMRYIGSGKPMSRPDAWRHMAMVVGHWRLRGYGLWAVIERNTGSLVGRVGCWQPEDWPGFEIGWMLRREYWGRGFAIEAARASLRWAFTDLDQPRAISLIQPANTASIRVAEKLGERLERVTTVAGIEALVYGISRQTWLAQNAPGAQHSELSTQRGEL